MMNFAEVWRIRARHTNLCEDVEKYPEHKRERFLAPGELKALGEALSQAERDDPDVKYAVAAYLLLLTGCRLSEIQTLKWSSVDLERREFRLPDSKTGAKTVHFGPIVADVLKGIERVGGQPLCDRRQSGRSASNRPPAALAPYTEGCWSRRRAHP